MVLYRHGRYFKKNPTFNLWYAVPPYDGSLAATDFSTLRNAQSLSVGISMVNSMT
jgi:hypothetical protein